ncbi:ras family-domain-containing protein, partial [Suillus subluteus]
LQFSHDGWSPGLILTISLKFKGRHMDAEVQYIRIEIEYEIGEERFRAVAKTSYRGIGGNMIVYDVTNQTTFDNIRAWYECVNMMLLGNKADGSDSRIVMEEQGKALADQPGIQFMETRQDEGVDWTLVMIKLVALQGYLLKILSSSSKQSVLSLTC